MPREMLTMLAEAVLALRATSELAVSWDLARRHLYEALGAHQAALLRVERRLATSPELSSGLLELVATELRSPLASVKAYSESLEQVADSAAATRTRFLGVINEECDRMASLLGDVNDLSRIEGGECTLRLSSVTLRELLAGPAEEVAPLAAARGVRLEIQADDLRVEVDAGLMRRCIRCLLANAIEFSPPSGTVRLTLADGGDEWSCVVEDDGAALPETDLESVFDHFHRARHVPSGIVRGPGPSRLGLAIARGIAELHCGRLWAEQPAAGANGVPGARFCLTAPARQTASARARRIARQALGRADLQPLFEAIVE